MKFRRIAAFTVFAATSVFLHGGQSVDVTTASYGILDTFRIGNSTTNPRGEPFPRTITDVWMDADGTAYITAPRSTGIRAAGIWKSGKFAGNIPELTGLVIAGNSTAVFTAESNTVYFAEKKSDSTPRIFAEYSFTHSSEFSEGYPDGYGIRGLSASDRFLYIANTAESRIEKWEIAAKKKIAEFPFARPGDILESPETGLWIIRDGIFDRSRRETVVVRGDRSLRYPVLTPACIVRIDSETGAEIETLPDCGIPVALAGTGNWNKGRPALLVADNGESQQVLAYSRRFSFGKFSKKDEIGYFFGAGHKPVDKYSEAGFSGLTGIGIAPDGKIHVFQNWNVNSTRNPEYPVTCSEWTACSKSGDKAETLACNLSSDGSPAFSPKPPYDVFWDDARASAPWVNFAGGELDWRFRGRTSNPFRASALEKISGDSPERCYTATVLGISFLFKCRGNAVEFYRRDELVFGNSWVFTGAISSLIEEDGAGSLWADGSGSERLDGIRQLDERTPLERSYSNALVSVDSRGNIWFAAQINGDENMGFARWSAERKDTMGLPVYLERTPVPVPKPFSCGGIRWFQHDPKANRMIVAGYPAGSKKSGFPLACVYDTWGRVDESGRDAPPDHIAILDSRAGAKPGDGGFGFPDDMKIDGDMLFALYRSPLRIAVYDLNRGNMIALLRPDSDVTGIVEAAKSLSMSLTPEMEDECRWIVISSADGKSLPALRWMSARRPLGKPDAEVFPTADHCGESIKLRWSTGPCGIITGYNIYRKIGDEKKYTRLNPELLQIPEYTDSVPPDAASCKYGITVVNMYGEGPLKSVLRIQASGR